MLPATPASASHLGAREPPRIHHMHVPGCRLPSPAMQSARRTRSLKTGFRMRVEDPPRHRARPQNACCGAYRTGYWVSTATPGRADAGRDVACQAGARSSPKCCGTLLPTLTYLAHGPLRRKLTEATTSPLTKATTSLFIAANPATGCPMPARNTDPSTRLDTAVGR